MTPSGIETATFRLVTLFGLGVCVREMGALWTHSVISFVTVRLGMHNYTLILWSISWHQIKWSIKQPNKHTGGDKKRNLQDGVHFSVIFPELFILINWPAYSHFPNLETMEIWNSGERTKSAIQCFKTSLEKIKNPLFFFKNKRALSECRERELFSSVWPSSTLIKFSLLNEPENLKTQELVFLCLGSALWKKVSRGNTERERKKTS